MCAIVFCHNIFIHVQVYHLVVAMVTPVLVCGESVVRVIGGTLSVQIISPPPFLTVGLLLPLT